MRMLSIFVNNIPPAVSPDPMKIVRSNFQTL